MGLGPTMTAKDRLRCLFRVFVECGGQLGRRAGSRWAAMLACCNLQPVETGDR